VFSSITACFGPYKWSSSGVSRDTKYQIEVSIHYNGSVESNGIYIYIYVYIYVYIYIIYIYVGKIAVVYVKVAK
jgi:hypothetical protein